MDLFTAKVEFQNYIKFNFSVVSFNCQSCCRKSYSQFQNARALVTAVQWSLVVNDLSITLFLKICDASLTRANL